MHILLFSVDYFPNVGWAEVAWQELTKRMPQYTRHMIVAKMNPRLAYKEKIGNVMVWRLGIGSPIIDKFLYLLFAPLWWIVLHMKYRYAVCVGVMASRWGAAATLFHRYMFKKVPYILNLQDWHTDEVIQQRTKYIWRFYKRIFASASYVTVIAHFLAQRAKENNFFWPIWYLPNGVDIPFFSKEHESQPAIDMQKKAWGRDPSTKVIISTSRLDYKNGIADIIKALPFLSPDHVFVCLGEGELRPQLEKLVKDLHVEKRVQLPGFVGHKDMLKYLSCADYFCRPSLQEWLGNSFLEAMVFWLPIIATPVWGILDFLKDGVNGFFCQVQDPPSIAQAIQRIDDLTSQERLALHAAAKATVVDTYDREKIAKKYDSLFLQFYKTKQWNNTSS